MTAEDGQKSIEELTHDALVERAVGWLSGSRRCNVVLSGMASAGEIPDAIGWSTAYKWLGSTVIECKTSIEDFYRESRKYSAYEHPEHGYSYSAKRMSRKEAHSNGYKTIAVPRMGDFRFFACRPGVLSPELIEKHHPDHGLIYFNGRRAAIVRDAKRREDPALSKEVRMLQFALIHARDNLVNLGCTVNLNLLTKFFGTKGIDFPEAALASPPSHRETKA